MAGAPLFASEIGRTPFRVARKMATLRDDIDHVEDADLEWMNLDAGELEDIKCLMEKLTRKAEKPEAKWKKKASY